MPPIAGNAVANIDTENDLLARLASEYQLIANLAVMTSREAAIYLRLSRSHLAAFRSKGNGPPFIAQGPRKCLYRKADLDRWLEERARVNNASVG